VRWVPFPTSYGLDPVLLVVTEVQLTFLAFMEGAEVEGHSEFCIEKTLWKPAELLTSPDNTKVKGT
jgi:hypothetical protein